MRDLYGVGIKQSCVEGGHRYRLLWVHVALIIEFCDNDIPFIKII